MPRPPPALLCALWMTGAIALSCARPAVAAGEAPAAPPPPPPASAPPAAAECIAPPKYELLRHREDWSALLRQPRCDRPDWTDRLKALEVAACPCVWANAGGQVRGRTESWSEQGFGSIPGDDAWGLVRARAHLDLHVGPHLRLFTEGIWGEEDGRDVGPRPSDRNRGDVLNLFLEGSWGGAGCGPRAGLWVGRRELSFGKQRVVSPADWTNVRRAFQGAGGWIAGSDWRLNAFWSRPVRVAADEGDAWDEGTEFAGTEAHFDRAGGRTVEAYLLYLDRQSAVWQGTTGRETRWTVGAGSWGPISTTRFDYDFEAALQVGDFDGQTISAGMATVELGWRPCVPCFEPRVALGADWASGDDDGPGGSLGTYNQLFPTGHTWFGWADLQARQNVVAARITATVKPFPKLLVRADLHRFWRAADEDAAYAATGAVLRAGGGSARAYVATELDVQAKYTIDRHWELELGYAHAWAGDFIKDTGAREDVDFWYAQVTFTF